MGMNERYVLVIVVDCGFITLERLIWIWIYIYQKKLGAAFKTFIDDINWLPQKYGVLFPPDETLLQNAADKFNEESSWVTVPSTSKKDNADDDVTKKTTDAKTTETTTKTTTMAETTPLWKVLTTRWGNHKLNLK